MTTQQNRLNRSQSLKLAAHIQIHYAESKKNFVDFAAEASKVLGFGVSPGTVSGLCRDLEIPSNQPRDPGASRQGVAVRKLLQETIPSLEMRISALEAKLSSKQ